MPIDSTLRVEVFVQLTVNGRPMWIKSKRTKPEHTARMTDKEYDRVVDAAIKELGIQSNVFKEKQEAKAEK